ncbi:hypothetical protein [Clostridium estertheticum]|nr:hypothetical protein [Clostridium estertheticum]
MDSDYRNKSKISRSMNEASAASRTVGLLASIVGIEMNINFY